MSLKGFAVFVAVLGVLVVYVHEYHGDVNIYVMQKFPVLKTLAIHIHGYLHEGKRLLDEVIGPQSIKQSAESEPPERVFRLEELAKYNGKEGSPGIYISILGKVYDVKKGIKHYGPDGSYHVFAGRDASRSFVTGQFEPRYISDKVADFSTSELQSLYEWAKFYHREYEYKGKLAGRYYTATGEKTSYAKKIDDLIKEAVEKDQARNIEHLKYPPCNVEWSQGSGSRVWCSNRSGGIERDWAGVPRKLYTPGSDSYRCACVQWESEIKGTSEMQNRTGNLELYDNCAPDSISCFTGE